MVANRSMSILGLQRPRALPFPLGMRQEVGSRLCKLLHTGSVAVHKGIA